MNIFTRPIAILQLVYNDLRYIHWKAGGVDFVKLHRLAENLYYTLESHIDKLSEWAIELGYPVPNVSKATEIAPDYLVESQDNNYNNYLSAIELIRGKLQVLIDELETLRQSNAIPADVQSSLDEMIRYHKSYKDYKLAQIVNQPYKLPPNFIATGLDNALAFRFSTMSE